MMTADFSELRVKMVDGQIRTTDVTNLALLTAMLEVPREALRAGQSQAGRLYRRGHPDLGDRATAYLMEPSPFAKLVQLAEIGENDKVLVSAAAPAIRRRCCRVWQARSWRSKATRRSPRRRRPHSPGSGYDNVAVVRGPLQDGHKKDGPYDVIFVAGSVEEVPEALSAQLAEGGRLVVVEGRGNAGVARLYLKSNGVADWPPRLQCGS